LSRPLCLVLSSFFLHVLKDNQKYKQVMNVPLSAHRLAPIRSADVFALMSMLQYSNDDYQQSLDDEGAIIIFIA